MLQDRDIEREKRFVFLVNRILVMMEEGLKNKYTTK